MPKPSDYWERLFFSQKPFRLLGYLGMAYVLGYVGFGCLVVGIISDALNLVLGLEASSWFLTGIGSLVLGLWFWLEWTQVKKEE